MSIYGAYMFIYVTYMLHICVFRMGTYLLALNTTFIDHCCHVHIWSQPQVVLEIVKSVRNFKAPRPQWTIS